MDYIHLKENEKKSIAKLISIKGLKKIKLALHLIDEEITKFEGINYDVKKLNIEWYYDKEISNNKKCLLYYLQEKFPNVIQLKIFYSKYGRGFGVGDEYDLKFKIKENDNCKVTKFKLILNEIKDNNCGIEFYCGPYNKLESINIRVENQLKDLTNINESFPIFYEKCPIIFESLKILSLDFEDLEILKILYNNIYNMPNLIEFSFLFNNKYNISEDFYKNFIRRILSLKFIKVIKLIKDKNFPRYYSEDDIREMIQGINFEKYNIIEIQKFNDDDDEQISDEKLKEKKKCILI